MRLSAVKGLVGMGLVKNNFWELDKSCEIGMKGKEMSLKDENYLKEIKNPLKTSWKTINFVLDDDL